jgi:hypothetical protein
MGLDLNNRIYNKSRVGFVTLLIVIIITLLVILLVFPG